MGVWSEKREGEESGSPARRSQFEGNPGTFAVSLVKERRYRRADMGAHGGGHLLGQTRSSKVDILYLAICKDTSENTRWKGHTDLFFTRSHPPIRRPRTPVCSVYADRADGRKDGRSVGRTGPSP